MRGRYLIAIVPVFVWVGETAAQTVRGSVLEQETGQPVVQAAVSATAGGRELVSVLSDSTGGFVLQLPSSGSYSLRAVRLGYAPSAPVRVEVRDAGTVEVLIRVRPEAIRLGAVTATLTRGRMPRAATVDGLYERRAMLPRVGGSRVFVKGDVELTSAGRVGDVLDRWLQVSRTARGRCVVYFVNGVPQAPLMDPASFVRGMSPTALEGLEYYRDHLTAPLDYQGYGCWQAPIYSIIAVWFER